MNFNHQMPLILLALFLPLRILVAAPPAAAPAGQDPQAAFAVVKTSISEIISILQNEKGEDKRASREGKISKLYYANFDLVELSKMTLKQDWKNLDKDQQQIFVSKFAEYVLSFYVGKLESYNNNKIEFTKAEKVDNQVVVHTLVEYNGAMSKVDYFMRLNKKGEWKIYDVEIEGVRLSSTYRQQFSQLFAKNKFADAIKIIEEKTAQQKSAPK